MEKVFTVSVFTEDSVGILNRITIIFTRRHLNISSITASESEVEGVFRYTIVLSAKDEQILKVVGQIEKLIDVIKVFVNEDSEIVHQELALYKIRISGFSNTDVEKVIRENHARILTIDPEFLVIEKTGHVWETQQLFEKLKPFGILEFARSGRVAVSKSMKELTTYLKDLEHLN